MAYQPRLTNYYNNGYKLGIDDITYIISVNL